MGDYWFRGLEIDTIRAVSAKNVAITFSQDKTTSDGLRYTIFKVANNDADVQEVHIHWTEKERRVKHIRFKWYAREEGVNVVGVKDNGKPKLLSSLYAEFHGPIYWLCYKLYDAWRNRSQES